MEQDANQQREQAYQMTYQNLMTHDSVNCKKAMKEHVSHYSIFVARVPPTRFLDDAEAVNLQMLIVSAATPKKWFLMTKYRNDRDWRIILTPDEPDKMTLLHFTDAVLITSRRLVVSQPTVMEFFLQAAAELHVEERPIMASLCDFCYKIDPDPPYIQGLFTALRGEHFSTVKSVEQLPPAKPGENVVTWDEVNSPYTILQAVHPTQLSAISALMETYDARANQEGRQQDWSSIMQGKQEVFVAYTTEGMKTAALEGTGYPQIAGYLAASKLVSEYPRLISLVVIPDERRHGLATLLLKRYFAQTAAKMLICSVPKLLQLGDRKQESYHVAALLKKMGGRLDKYSRSTWRFMLPNPYEKLR